jgi:RNA polymerase sigma-70 factor (ECF subfamily)
MARAAVPSLTAAPLPGELEELFAEHYQQIYRTAYSVTGCRHDADDVVQNLFLRLLRRGLPPDFNRNPKGYLYRAAVNLSLSIVRGRKRQQAVDDVEVLLRPVPAEAAKPDNDRQRALVDAVAQLNPRASKS